MDNFEKQQILTQKKLKNNFGSHSIFSKIMVTDKVDENINFEFSRSYFQNNHWGNY